MTVIDTLEFNSVQAALTTSCQPDIRRLSVIETEDRVEVFGRVSSFYMKSVAIETVKAVAEGRTLLINIEVDR